MRKSLLAILIVTVIFTMTVVPVVQATVACSYARFHPGFAMQCFMEMMMDMGGGYNDWGDPGDGDDITG